MIARIATRQHGVLARWQLQAFGFGKTAIDRRIAQGRLHPVHIGAYAVGHAHLTRKGRWMAAVLACGPGAVLSHRNAGALWGILDLTRSRIDVSAPRSRDGRPGIALHRPRRLLSEDLAIEDGIPVTSLARTLLDLASVVLRRQLDRAVEQAERLRVLDLRAVERLLDRCRGHHGRGTLLAAVSIYREPPRTRSDLERDFLALCKQANLPPPQVNVAVSGYEVDAAWPDRGLVVELDSRAFHDTQAAFERDRIRDAALQLDGYRVVRVTYRRLRSEPAAIVDTVRALLASHHNTS